MTQETEIKLRIDDPRRFERQLKRLGARPLFRGLTRVHEMNIILDTAERDLARNEHLLRIRTQKVSAPGHARAVAKLQRSLVTFKRPIRAKLGRRIDANGGEKRARYKILEEIEMQVADAATMTKIFEALGLNCWFRYEKFRSTYQFPASIPWAKGLLIELDETPIGFFAELEGPAAAIDRAARRLGFSPESYIQANYLDLYVQSCRQSGRTPGDMLFQKGK